MFQDTMLQINNGEALVELSDSLEKVVAAVRQTGRAGTITLTLKVKPVKGSTNIMIVDSTVKAKLPEAERGTTIFYATEENKLVRNDPRQTQLPLRIVDIDQPSQDLKEVG